MESIRAEALFDLSSFDHRELFDGCRFVWEALGKISSHLQRRLNGNVSGAACFREPLPRTIALWKGKVWSENIKFLGGDVTKGTFLVSVDGEETAEATVIMAGSVLWDEDIMLGAGTVVEPGALIKGPTIVGAHTEIRQGAYIRGKCIVGDRCVVGHTTEMKSSVMLNDAKAGHFAYIGDSILGNSTNLGAGTKLANLKIIESTVRVKVKDRIFDSGLRKFGAILGDRVEIGCNAVTNPGTVLGKECLVLPVTSVSPGYYEPGSMVTPRG